MAEERVFEQSTSFSRPWGEVSSAFFARYPNPSAKHIMTVVGGGVGGRVLDLENGLREVLTLILTFSQDTVEQYTKDGKLYTTRLIQKASIFDRFTSFLRLPNKPVFVTETSVVRT